MQVNYQGAVYSVVFDVYSGDFPVFMGVDNFMCTSLRRMTKAQKQDRLSSPVNIII